MGFLSLVHDTSHSHPSYLWQKSSVGFVCNISLSLLWHKNTSYENVVEGIDPEKSHKLVGRPVKYAWLAYNVDLSVT